MLKASRRPWDRLPACLFCRQAGSLSHEVAGFDVVVFLLAMILTVAIVSPAAAHKASVFAAVRGKTISGEAYFRDGAPVRNARVTVFDAGGGKLGETQTDSAGQFSFEPSRRCDLRLVVDAGDGHAAEYTVHADELPAGLAAGGQTAAPTTEVAPVFSSFGETKEQPGTQNSQPRDSVQGMRGDLEAIQAQIVLLRRDLAAREDRARWSDVLGGIGYVLGLMGLAFYFLGVRRKGRGIRDDGPKDEGVKNGGEK